MKIKTIDSLRGKRIMLIDGDKTLGIEYDSNLDLYWHIDCPSNEIDYDKEFNLSMDITKENAGIYYVFDELYSDIENVNVGGYYLQENMKYCIGDKFPREDMLHRYRVDNKSNYKELFNPEEKKITWYSDEVNHEVGNYLNIYKLDDLYRLDFHTQLPKEGFDKDNGSSQYIPIKFSNSGSRYDPFNIVFIRMYNNIKKVDDINDHGHQIHLDEYIYAKTKTLKQKTK